MEKLLIPIELETFRRQELTGTPDELIETYDHIEEMMKYKPKSKMGKIKLIYYKKEMCRWKMPEC